ncbi:agglutinin biogenesis protein MshP [Rugamonas sp. CCM 8940]|nr:agglutinin biogenesis protein MshP [Rugamonas sp. CCM 8940]
MRVRALRRAAGVGMVTAIFLLVALAGLAVAMVSLMTTQQSSAALDEQGARAYQAARAGLEWALWVRLQGASAAPPIALACPGTYNFDLPPNNTLSAFSVTVVCTAAQGVGQRIQIQSTACAPAAAGSVCPNPAPGADYVQRQLQAEL